MFNLLESDVTADSDVLLRRHKKQLKRKMQGRLMNILFPRLPLWDPDRVLKRWMPLVRHLMSPIGAIIWLIVVGLLAYEHSLVSPGDLSRLDMAFFNVNGYIAVVVLVATVFGL